MSSFKHFYALILSMLCLLMLSACAPQQFNQGTSALLTSLAKIPLSPRDSAGLPRWDEDDCRFSTDLDATIICGYVTVPEDRSQTKNLASRRTIRLHIAIIKSRNDNPEPDPVIYLSGGPGGQTLVYIKSIAARFEEILQNRDLILLDQRGIGFSEPTLDCPELMDWKLDTLDQPLSQADSIGGNLAAMVACRDRLVEEGINLVAYTSAENAADLNDIRIALGYDQVNLYGVSYGTRLALTAMRDGNVDYGIRSVILDSIFPPQVDFYADLAVDAQNIFDLFFARCAGDEACNTAYPNLERNYYDLVQKLQRDPITLEVMGYRNSGPYTMILNGDKLIRLLFNMLYDTSTVPEIPKLLSNMTKDDYTDRLTQIWLRWLVISNLFRSEGMWYSVMCGEEVGFTSEAIVRERGTDVHPNIYTYFIDLASISDFAVCHAWYQTEMDALENAPVDSNLPTLILVGELDPITPPRWNQLAAETLSQSYYFEFPGVGHGILRARPCARMLSKAFLDDPWVEPNSTCLNALPSLEFVIE